MCRRVECRKCGMPTFAGCGAHVEQVLGDVPPAMRCRCDERSVREASRAGAAAPSFLERLFGSRRR